MNDRYNYSYLDDKGIYTYEDTGVLINKLNIRKADEFYVAERSFTNARANYLDNHPIKGNFDLEHLKAIHKYLFQDLFYWAGKIRTVPIAKKNMFCLPQYIETYANDIFTELKKNNYYLGQHKEKFVESITNLLGDINALHPFREGNGRTQREFVRLLCNKNGYDLDWSKITPEENIVASYESVNGDNTKLKEIIARIIYEI